MTAVDCPVGAEAQNTRPRFSAAKLPLNRGSRRARARKCKGGSTTTRAGRGKSGLFLNNRHYDPTTGIFISVDPLVTLTGEPYLYGSANPVTMSDPEGLCAWSYIQELGCYRSPGNQSAAEHLEARRGHKIDTVGDLDAAENIVVFVPGAGTSRQNYDTDVRQRTSLMVDAIVDAGGGSTAGVGWLGYSAPGLLGAVSGDSADEAHPAFGKYVTELSEQYPDANLVLVGHSYGSVVIGRSIAHGEVPDDPSMTFVYMGSPGFVRGDLKSSFKEWSGHTIGTTGSGDWLVPSNGWSGGRWHGSAVAGQSYPSTGGHDDYWTPENLGRFGTAVGGRVR